MELHNRRKNIQPLLFLKKNKMKDALICDLDGTLCLFGKKDPYNRDFENDEENPAVIDILYRIDACNQQKAEDFMQIIFVSGRNERHCEVTRQWLKERGLDEYPLFMRGIDDFRKDYIVKKEMYERNIEPKYNVKFVLDDRNQMVTMWRSLGITCLQVAEGDF